MPHFLNNTHDAVTEAIEGLCIERHSTICTVPNYPNVIALQRGLVDKTRVAVICGGGSGHEPMHGGFVAPGFLSAAVCGRVFASPPISHIRAAVDYLIANGAPSVLVLVKRYTGDIINFGAAVEASAGRYGADKVAMAVIGDDVTFGPNDADARGLAGTVLWYKLITAVAASEHGAGMTAASLKTFADAIGKHIRSMGASLQSCTLPGATTPNATIPEGEVELGLGIHGERGSKSTPFNHSIDEVVQRMLGQLLTPIGSNKSCGVASGNNKDATGALSPSAGTSWIASITEGGNTTAATASPADLLVYVNNLGGTSNLEMSVIVRSLTKALCGLAMGGAARAALLGAGAICTSLNMHGFSITLINLTAMAADTAVGGSADGAPKAKEALVTVEGLKKLFLSAVPDSNSMCLAVGPSADAVAAIIANGSSSAKKVKTEEEAAGRTPTTATTATPFTTALVAALAALKASEAKYNAFDAACGDGDTGTGIAQAAEALLANNGALVSGLAAAAATNTAASPSTDAFVAVGNTICDNMAGSMGALLSIFVSGMTAGMGSTAGASSQTLTTATIAAMLRSGAQAVKRVIGTVAGDRTFIDVTEAVAEAMEKAAAFGQTLAEVKGAIVDTITATTLAVSNMTAKKGRARYLGGREVGTRDPGAEIVGDFIVALLQGL